MLTRSTLACMDTRDNILLLHTRDKSSGRPCVGPVLRILLLCISSLSTTMALAQSSLKTSRVCAGRPAGTFSAPRPALQRRTLICRAEPVVAGPVTDETFETLVLKSKVPVLIDFWAPWCGPCRMIAPLIDEIAGEYQGKLTCYKLNTDESPGVATEYGIRSIPTVMIFKNGQKMETIIGAVPKVTLIQSVEKFLTVTSA